MIDFHNHTIPNLDDGPKSIEDSLQMFKEAEKQGITDVINTVHYQHPKMDGKDTSYKNIILKINEMNGVLIDNNINIKIHPASEVFYLPNLIEILDNKITTFGKGKYMLIEFQTLSLPNGYKEEFYKLMLKGTSPIIAHPERYREIQADISIVKEWVDLGYIIQIDCGSILGQFGEKIKKTSYELIKNNLCHIIGSDSHNSEKRNFCLLPAYKEIENNISSDYVTFLKNNIDRIFNGKEINSHIYNNKESKNGRIKKILSFLETKVSKL